MILTTCDRPDYLDQAIASVRAQTFTDFEVLVCDDASSEETAVVVARHAAEDVRIVHHRRPRRVGFSLNVVRGLHEATADLFTIINDDDAWEASFLEKTVTAIREHPQASIAFSDHYIISEDGRVDLEATDENTKRWGRDDLAPGLHRSFMREALIAQAVPAVMAAVFRCSTLDLNDFPPEVGGHYDLWLTYMACRDGSGAFYVPERLTRYRVHRQSATARAGVALAESSVYIWTRLIEDDRLVSIRDDLRIKRQSALTTLGVRQLRDSQRDLARHTLLAAVRQRPTPRAALGLALTLAPAAWTRRLLRRHPPTRA